MKRVLELRAKRANLIDEARKILEAAPAEGMGAEDEARWNTLMDQAEKVAKQIEQEERMAAATASVDDGEDPGERRRDASSNGDGRGKPPVFVSRGLRGLNEVDPEWQQANEWRGLMATTTPGYRRGFNQFLRGGMQSVGVDERRAMQVDLDASGGYLVMPMQFVDGLLKDIDDQVYMEQWATVYAVPEAKSLGVVTLEADPADAEWTTEIAAITMDTQMSFGRRELSPKPLRKGIKISDKLLRSAPSTESLVRSRLAYKFGITKEKAFQVGSGAGQPLGVFVASNDGIPTSRDVATGNTATGPTFDGMIEAKYALKGGYWARARWLAHRNFWKLVAKLKDGDGQYLWRLSVREGEPDTCLGLPMFMSEYSPNTFTANQYVAILGDFSNYWIANALDLRIKRLVELYDATGQIGFHADLESDGQPVRAEAFVRVKLGA